MAFKFLGQRQLGKLPSRWVSTILMVAIRAHLLTTCQGPMVVLPDGSRAPSGGGSAGVSFPAGIYQQTPTAACASDAAAPITGGLGAIGHQQAAPGIYRCIACHYYQCL